MAITSATSNNGGSSSTTLVVTHPTNAAGDLLVVICGLDVGAGASTSSPAFTELKDETGTDVWAWIGYRVSAGSEASTTLTHTSERGNAISYCIPAAEWHGTSVPEITAVGDGTSTTPDPPSITPSWGASQTTTYIATAILDDSAGVSTVSSWPTNYTLNQVTSNTSTSAASVHAAIRLLSGSPENPGTFTVSPSEHWRTYTIAVRGSAGTTLAPGSVTATASGKVPVIVSTIPPPAATLTLTGQVPLISIANALVPASVTATLSGKVPVIVTAEAPPAATATLSGKVPALVTAEAPAAATATLSGKVPVIVANVVPARGLLALTGQVPVITIGAGGTTLSPARALLTLMGQVPLVAVSGAISGGLGPSGGRVGYGGAAGVASSLHPVASVRNTNPTGGH